MNNYEKNKEKLRQLAIKYQRALVEGETYFYSEVATMQDYLYRNGKKYGLLKEFRENGII